MPGDRPREDDPEEGRAQEEEDHQQTQGDAPDRGVSERKDSSEVASVCFIVNRGESRNLIVGLCPV